MRRPSPLPVPPASGRPSEPELADAAPAGWDRRAEETTDGTAETETEDLSAVRDGRFASGRGSEGDDAAVRGGAGEVDGDAAPRAEDAETGLRDVWRAARARRRALRAEVRRFTVRQRRRRWTWLGVIGALVLLVAGSVGAAYSPLFAVENIEVVGTDQLDADEVEDALSDLLGTPLPLVDESEVKAGLVAFPLVETYTLEARPPHDLVVRIVERTPVGVIESAAGFTLVDAAGVALATTPDAPSGQPLLTIDGGTASDAFRAAGQVVRSLPETIRLQLSAVSATSPDDVTLTLEPSGARVIWGSAEDSAEKGVVLEELMNVRPPDTVTEYDVSSPSAVVTR